MEVQTQKVSQIYNDVNRSVMSAIRHDDASMNTTDQDPWIFKSIYAFGKVHHDDDVIEQARLSKIYWRCLQVSQMELQHL